jgi:hypothetical protein
MHPTLRSARLRRGAVVAAAGALALGLLPLTTSSAAPLDQVSYVSSTSLGANAGAPDGTATSPLTASGYRTFSLDVSRDGSTALLAVCHGTYVPSGATSANPSQCTNQPDFSDYDASFGLVLVHRDSVGGTVRAKVLSTQWDANPVLTTNGSTTSAWFLLDGVLYTYAINEAAGSWNVSDSSAAVTVANATAFQPLKDSAGQLLESTTGLAVASDGSQAAATYLRPGPVLGRVKAATISTGAQLFQNTFSRYRTVSGVTTWQPTSSVLAYQGSTLLFGQTQYADSGQPGPIRTFEVTGATATSHIATLDDYYGVRQTSTGAWWMWKDASTAAGLSQLADANLLTTAPTPISSRADGSTTFNYVPSAVTPPSLGEVSDLTNPALISVPVAHVALAFSTKAVGYKGRAAYASSNYYWAPLPSRAYSTSYAAEVDKGTLFVSTDKATWTPVASTSGASAFAVGSKYYNGYTPVQRRNTFYYWSYAGDALTGAGSTATSPGTVLVVPTVSVSVAHRGRSTRVSGAITAWAGTMYLYQLRSGKWRFVASTPITPGSKNPGTYTFGYKSLVHGTYKVANVGTTGVGWASGSKTFVN